MVVNRVVVEVEQDPRFPALSVANTRLARRVGARTRDEFERGLPQVGWFARLGMRRVGAPHRRPSSSDLARQTHWHLSGWTGVPVARLNRAVNGD